MNPSNRFILPFPIYGFFALFKMTGDNPMLYGKGSLNIGSQTITSLKNFTING